MFKLILLMLFSLACLVAVGIINTIACWGQPYDLTLITRVPWYSWVIFAIGAGTYLLAMNTKVK